MVDIQENQKSATVRLTYRRREPIPEIVGRLVDGVAVNGSGGVVVGGKYHAVPPRGPEFELVRALGRYLSTEVEGAVGADHRDAARTTPAGGAPGAHAAWRT